MTDDPPHWFGEPTEEETQPVDPPTVAVDWFSDIESDTLPKRSTASQATEAPASARQDREETAATETQPSEAPEADTASAEAATAGSAESEGRTTARAESADTGTARSADGAEMDGTRETTAEEMDDGDDSGGFVGWLKSLFGLS